MLWSRAMLLYCVWSASQSGTRRCMKSGFSKIANPNSSFCSFGVQVYSGWGKEGCSMEIGGRRTSSPPSWIPGFVNDKFTFFAILPIFLGFNCYFLSNTSGWWNREIVPAFPSPKVACFQFKSQFQSSLYDISFPHVTSFNGEDVRPCHTSISFYYKTTKAPSNRLKLSSQPWIEGNYYRDLNKQQGITLIRVPSL